MTTAETIAGYTYDTGAASRSPVSPAELLDLERAVGFGPDDEGALRELWEVLAERREEIFAIWMNRVAHFFLPTFVGSDGVPIQAYVDAAHPRFLKWIEDTCTRPRDQAWLDYQHEIGLRHHRTRKNQTDGVDSTDIVPFRYLVAALYPLTATLRPFLRHAGVDDAPAERLEAAWTKALILQVALWSRAYLGQDW